jgi:NAD(P)-dependent dehydrogenase (short-subunit alcohol dehydrogenase family)
MMKHPKPLSRLDGKVAVVTGASDGIGVETARYLADLGATLVLPVRNMEKAAAVRDDLARTTGSDRIELMPMDLASLASVRAFAAALREKHPVVDVLVLNAGLSPTKRSLTAEGFETTMGVNHLGHFALTLELLPALKAAPRARVVVLSSKLHTSGRIPFDDLHYEKGFTGNLMRGPYPDSKLANALFAVELAERLKGDAGHGQLRPPGRGQHRPRPRHERLLPLGRPHLPHHPGEGIADQRLRRRLARARRRDREVLRRLQGGEALRPGARRRAAKAPLGRERVAHRRPLRGLRVQRWHWRVR